MIEYEICVYLMFLYFKTDIITYEIMVLLKSIISHM